MRASLALCCLLQPALAQLTLDVQPSGAYTVTYPGITLSSAAAAFAVRYDGALHSTADGSLALDAPPAPTSGNDAMGAYTGFDLTFNSGVFGASFKLYADLNALLFTQSFPKGLTGMAAAGDHSPANDLSTAFPVFGPPEAQLNTSLAYLTWPECMSTGHVGRFRAAEAGNTGLQGNSGTPLTLFAEGGQAVVLSPVSGMMTAQVVFAGAVGTALGAGHNGMVTEVPAGWTQETLLVAGDSVNATVMAFGDQLLARSGKPRTAPDADLVISTLGYWTDNGACASTPRSVSPAPLLPLARATNAYLHTHTPHDPDYYYLSEPGKDMQDTVMDVLSYWQGLGLPVRHLMYDSWW